MIAIDAPGYVELAAGLALVGLCSAAFFDVRGMTSAEFARMKGSKYLQSGQYTWTLHRLRWFGGIPFGVMLVGAGLA